MLWCVKYIIYRLKIWYATWTRILFSLTSACRWRNCCMSWSSDLSYSVLGTEPLREPIMIQFPYAPMQHQPPMGYMSSICADLIHVAIKCVQTSFHIVLARYGYRCIFLSLRAYFSGTLTQQLVLNQLTSYSWFHSQCLLNNLVSSIH